MNVAEQLRRMVEDLKGFGTVDGMDWDKIETNPMNVLEFIHDHGDDIAAALECLDVLRVGFVRGKGFVGFTPEGEAALRRLGFAVEGDQAPRRTPNVLAQDQGDDSE